MAVLLTTARLVIRDWTSDDAEAAFSVYGDGRVAPWLLPAMSSLPGKATAISAPSTHKTASGCGRSTAVQG